MKHSELPRGSFRLAGGIVKLQWGFTLFVVLGTLFLLGLGLWQIQRMAWKNELVATIQQHMSAPPQSLPDNITDPANLDYHRFTITGVFRHEHEFHLAARELRYSTYGYHILTPLELANGQWVLVNRGWVSPERKAAASRPNGQSSDVVTVTGIARLPKPRGWLVPENAPEKNVWLWLDLPAMAQQLGQPLAPMVLEADATPNAGDWPVGGQTRVSFRSNHLTYALTWLLLAIALPIIGIIKQWQRHHAE